MSFEFKLKDYRDTLSFITLWTQKPENVEDIKFIAVSRNHILAGDADTDSTVKLPFLAINPFTAEEIPIFITNEIEFLEGTDSYVG